MYHDLLLLSLSVYVPAMPFGTVRRVYVNKRRVWKLTSQTECALLLLYSHPISTHISI